MSAIPFLVPFLCAWFLTGTYATPGETTGCILDKALVKDSLLPNFQNFGRNLRPDVCKAYCGDTGYRFWGVGGGLKGWVSNTKPTMCYCGYTAPPISSFTTENKCDAKCPGDNNMYCGGYKSIGSANVYKTVGPTDVLPGKTLQTVEDKTIIRLFTPEGHTDSHDWQEIWDSGKDVICSPVAGSIGVFTFAIPPSLQFNKGYDLKVFTHGFTSTVKDDKAEFVHAWMHAHKNKVNVLLFDWSELAMPLQSFTDPVGYDSAARNALDAGRYLGNCLRALNKEKGVSASKMHLVGHSLGAHLMGRAGREFSHPSGPLIGRITGLDPAGPRWVDGAREALPDLAENILSKRSATFVDVIHTNGDETPTAVAIPPILGLLQNLGHLDFYPNGGRSQPSCTGPLASQCSHTIAVNYYLRSIYKPKEFVAKLCSKNSGSTDQAVLSAEVSLCAAKNSVWCFWCDHMGDKVNRKSKGVRYVNIPGNAKYEEHPHRHLESGGGGGAGYGNGNWVWNGHAGACRGCPDDNIDA